MSNNNKSDDYYDTRLALPISYTTRWVPIAVTNALGFPNSVVETDGRLITFACSANPVGLSTIAVASASVTQYAGQVAINLLADDSYTSFYWFAIGI
jgi:predicted ATPase